MNSDIAQAREYLDNAEKVTDPIKKRMLCQTAMELLDDVMEDDPEEKEKDAVRKIRKSFARSLVTQVENMNMNNIETTKFFISEFVIKYAAEIVELQKESPDFKRKFEWLTDQFRGDFA